MLGLYCEVPNRSFVFRNRVARPTISCEAFKDREMEQRGWFFRPSAALARPARPIPTRRGQTGALSFSGMGWVGGQPGCRAHFEGLKRNRISVLRRITPPPSPPSSRPPNTFLSSQRLLLGTILTKKDLSSKIRADAASRGSAAAAAPYACRLAARWRLL